MYLLLSILLFVLFFFRPTDQRLNLTRNNPDDEDLVRGQLICKPIISTYLLCTEGGVVVKDVVLYTLSLSLSPGLLSGRWLRSLIPLSKAWNQHMQISLIHYVNYIKMLFGLALLRRLNFCHILMLDPYLDCIMIISVYTWIFLLRNAVFCLELALTKTYSLYNV